MVRRCIAINKRNAVLLAALNCAFLVLLTNAGAQNAYPKDEVFGGYSALIPNGWGDLDYKINTIPNAFDASNTYYLPNIHNLGLLIDGSGHFKGSTTPPNLQNGSNDSTGVGYALGGLQYKFHRDKLSPFFRGFVGAANISPDCCHGTQWSLAAGGGGGLDLTVTPRFSIRLIQADYIYSHYSHEVLYVPMLSQFQQDTVDPHPTEWNSVRLAAGVVFSFGNYSTPQLASCTASASPSEVNAGEPVRLSSTGNNFIPKHSLTYGWTTTGGKLSSSTTEASASRYDRSGARKLYGDVVGRGSESEEDEWRDVYDDVCGEDASADAPAGGDMFDQSGDDRCGTVRNSHDDGHES